MHYARECDAATASMDESRQRGMGTWLLRHCNAEPIHTGVLTIRQITSLIRREPVLAAAGLLAFATLFIVPPDAVYREYIDTKTLLCLLGLMIALKGIEREGLIAIVSAKLSSRLGNLRVLTFFLVFTCFFASMLMTNDVALIALVPISLAVLSVCGQLPYAAYIIVLQTLAANIGSSLTPIGNPQNLFLFVRYGFEPVRFLLTMLPFVVFGGVLLAVSCLFLPNLPIRQEPSAAPPVRGKAAVAYGLMFCLAVAAVFGVLPYWISVAVIVAATFFVDKRTLLKVDYSLLLTFIAIFVFVGNIARIEWLGSLISGWVQRDTMLTALATSQMISNVPATVMLSGFTDNAVGLLIGVNVGGMGTLIASMASVISYKLYVIAFPNGTRRYMMLFTVMNVLFLALTLVFIKCLGVV